MDHVLLDREQPNNAGDQGRLVNVSLPERQRPAVSRKQQPTPMETCTVCGGSFKMGRGLSLHKTKSRCGALEASRKLYKSRKGGPQDQHHSGTTKESFPKSSASPQGTPRIEENKKENQQLAVESKDQGVKHHGNALSKSNTNAKTKKVQQKLDTILIVDDDIEREIKASVLSESTSMPRRTQLAKPKLDPKKRRRTVITDSRDIRSFVTVTKIPAKGKLSPRRSSKDSNAEVQLKRETLPPKDENTVKEDSSYQVIRISSTQGQNQGNISLKDSPGRKVKNPNKENSLIPPSNLDDTRQVVVGRGVHSATADQNLPGVKDCNMSSKQERSQVSDTGRVVASSGDHCAAAGRNLPRVIDSVSTQKERFRSNDTRRVVASSGAYGATASQNPPGVNNSPRSSQSRYHLDDIRRFVVIDGAKRTGNDQESPNTKDSKQQDEFRALVESLNSGPPDDVLSTHTINMRRRDYRTLTGINELNDKIVDEYLTLIKERNQQQRLQSVYTFPCYIFPHLLGNFDNFEYIERKIKVDLTTVDMVLIPINQSQHWSLVAVDIKERQLHYYDSIIGNQKRSSGPRICKKCLDLYFERKGISDKFQIKIKENAPVQRNTYDCGVFLCQNAEQLARRSYANSKQEDMPYFRRKMMQEIFVGHLIEILSPQIESQARISTEKKTSARKNNTRKKGSKGKTVETNLSSERRQNKLYFIQKGENQMA